MQKRSTQLVSLILNEPLNYDRMLEINSDQLEFMKHECEIVIQDLKKTIVQEYELIKPSLLKMREWKQQLIEVREKREAYKLFLSIDKNQSLFSCTSTIEERPPISLSDLFRDIDNDQLIEEPTQHQRTVSSFTPRRNLPHARPSTPVKKSSIPIRRCSVSEEKEKPQSTPNLVRHK